MPRPPHHLTWTPSIAAAVFALACSIQRGASDGAWARRGSRQPEATSPSSGPNAGKGALASAEASGSGAAEASARRTEEPSAPLTAVRYFPSKGRVGACADASVGIEFNRPPTLQTGKSITIREATGRVFDSVASNLDVEAGYLSSLTERTTGGKVYHSDALYVVHNTVVFHPKSKLRYGQTYKVEVEPGFVTDAMGTPFAAPSGWTFTVRAEAPRAADTYTLAADGSGDFCSVEGVLEALPDASASRRVVTVEHGVYPGIVRMSDDNVHFRGAGIDSSVFAAKNSSRMNRDREGFVLSGSDVTLEDLMLFNTFPHDGNGRQAEALLVAEDSERVFLDNVHLRSQQDTLRVENTTTYMKGGILSGSTDPLWGHGKFYCEGCELRSRSDGHSFVVARSDKGFALVNCTMTKEVGTLANTFLAQYHDNRPRGRIAFVGCRFDDHIAGWKRSADTWFEYGNRRLTSGEPVRFGGVQLRAGSPELDSLSSAQKWLGWSP